MLSRTRPIVARYAGSARRWASLQLARARRGSGRPRARRRRAGGSSRAPPRARARPRRRRSARRPASARAARRTPRSSAPALGADDIPLGLSSSRNAAIARSASSLAQSIRRIRRATVSPQRSAHPFGCHFLDIFRLSTNTVRGRSAAMPKRGGISAAWALPPDAGSSSILPVGEPGYHGRAPSAPGTRPSDRPDAEEGGPPCPRTNCRR